MTAGLIGAECEALPCRSAEVRDMARNRVGSRWGRRALVGVCAAEGMKLITLDRALAEHPLAWRDIPSVKK